MYFYFDFFLLVMNTSQVELYIFIYSISLMNITYVLSKAKNRVMKTHKIHLCQTPLQFNYLFVFVPHPHCTSNFHFITFKSRDIIQLQKHRAITDNNKGLKEVVVVYRCNTKGKTDESCYCKMVPCERLPQRQKVSLQYSCSNSCIQKPHCSQLTYCNSTLSFEPKLLNARFTLK